MLCPQCGADTPAPGGRCAACHAAVPPRVSEPVATGSSPSAINSQSETMIEVSPRRSTGRITHGPLEAGAPFGTRYRILRSLGAGGMGVVYQAWDDELGVAVALKVIRPEVTADPHVAREVERRFKRELLLARQVTHKNVVRIHDLGEVDGIKYITMPYIEGRDLAGVLHEAGALPVPRALRIAKQVAAGLQAAHEAGVIHRDLKPENIMIDAEDQALIMDFGISRTTRNTSATMTQHGAIVGTLEYMAPEQGRGATIDHRADIYAFGLMLHDMLAGRRRLDAADGPVAEMMSRMHKAPPPLRTLVPAIPEAVERIVSTCLQPDADQRYATTAELVADLERLDNSGHVIVTKTPRFGTKTVIAAAALVVAVAIGVAVWVLRPAPAPPAAREPVSVLIADFDNRAGDPVFEGALEQSLAIAMEGSPLVSVFPQRAARSIAPQVSPSWGGRIDRDIAQLISRREGIKVLLAGAIDRDGGGYRLSLRASDPADDSEIARAERTVGSKADVLQAVGALADRIRRELGESKTEMERLAAAETFTAGSVEAMRAYARGQELLNAGKYQDALESFQYAVRDDPQLGRAYAAMGAIYSNLKQTARAEASFQEAMKHLDRMSDREKYRTLATYYIGVAGNYEKAIENYEELLKIYPADTSYGNLAFAYLRTGNVARARDVARKGLDIDPKNLLQRTNYAAYSAYAADFETAVHEAERVLGENSRYEFGYLPLALAHLGQGNLDAALGAYRKLATVSDTGRSLAAAGIADVEMYAGRPDAVASVLAPGMALDEKLESTGELAAKHVVLAEASLARGNTAAAIAAARKAIATSSLLNVVVPAAGVLIEAGQSSAARAVATELDNRLQNESAAYSQVLLGQIALKERKLPEARTLLQESLKRQDTWLARFLVGRAYFEAGSPQQALDDWSRCYHRRGEALDMFFADTPTSRYLAPLHYWLGRAHEAVGATASARRAFEDYVKIRAGAAADPLLADARRRLEAR